MSNMQVLERQTATCGRDLPPEAIAKAREVGLVACDIETSGLNWQQDKIGTCQIFIPGFDVFIVQLNGLNGPAASLQAVLTDPNVRKVFHHAIFDLRFILSQWEILISNAACTKIASKILNPSEEDHTLKSVLKRYLGVHIEKELGASDWLNTSLTEEQVRYAVQDAIHLPALFAELERRLQSAGRLHLAEASFRYLPSRASLDILGVGDVYAYAHDQLSLRGS